MRLLISMLRWDILLMVCVGLRVGLRVGSVFLSVSAAVSASVRVSIRQLRLFFRCPFGVPFWSHFWTVWGLGGSPFFEVFLVPLLDGILVSFGAKVAPKRELLGIIFETIWRP